MSFIDRNFSLCAAAKLNKSSGMLSSMVHSYILQQDLDFANHVNILLFIKP